MTDRINDDRKVVVVPLWAMRDCDGNARDAMVLAEITYWLQPDQRNGRPRTRFMVERDGHRWLYRSDEDLGAGVGMSADQVYRARKALKAAGLIESMSRQVDGQKVTLVRPTPRAVDDGVENEGTTGPDSATPRNRSRDSAETGPATPRNTPPIEPDGEPVLLAPPAATKRATRLPEPFVVNGEMRQWVISKFPGLDYRDQTERFCDHFRAAPGQRGLKLDWIATWRNWMKNANDRRVRPHGVRTQRQADAVRTLAAQFAQEGR